MNILFFVQLITEFIPISSSGHVELIKNLIVNYKNLHWSIDFIAHFPAFIVAIFYFFSDFRFYFFNFKNKNFFKEFFFIFISSFIPVLFFFIKKRFNFSNFIFPYWYGFGITSFFLFKTKDFLKKEMVEKKKKEELNLMDSIFLGLAQSIAIFFPGISRFATTLLVSLFLGFSKKYSIILTTFLGCIFQGAGSFIGILYSLKYGLKEPIIETYSEFLFLIISLIFAFSWYFVILDSYKKNTLWYLGYYELIVAILGCLL